MRLLFEEIVGKTRPYSMPDKHLFPDDDEHANIVVGAKFSVTRQDKETVIVRGTLLGRRNTGCARCGEPVEEELEGEFMYLATTRSEDENKAIDIECGDEDALVLFLKEPVIDIDEILREQVLLAVPLRTLCDGNCKGICAGCGRDLNKGLCNCSPDANTSPFAVLKKLSKR